MNVYQFATINDIWLDAGRHVFRVVVDGSGMGKGNFDYFTINQYFPPQFCDPEWWELEECRNGGGSWDYSICGCTYGCINRVCKYTSRVQLKSGAEIRAALLNSTMKLLGTVLVFAMLSLAGGCSTSQHAQTKVQRKPLEKHYREYKSPSNYAWRDRGYDPKTGNMITYDHKPRVELTDEKTGKYAFKWIGYDGKEKTVIFQRSDVLDVIVSASVTKVSDQQYSYTYQVQNLPSSASYLKRFMVQNFASDVVPEKSGVFFVLEVSKSSYQFREGHWLSFSDASDHVQIDPGQAVTVHLTSSAPPGLVECRATIETSLLAPPDEEMPSALENLLPGYEEFPKGYTIGPNESLKTLSSSDRVKYVLEKLPQIRDLGWITQDAFVRYQRFLQSNDLTSVLNRLDDDLKSEQITTELFAIIQTIK